MLTSQKCALHIIVRGLVRVRCVQEMDRVLNFMTRKGLINTGVLAVKQPLLPERYRSVSVLVFTWSWHNSAHLYLYVKDSTPNVLSFLQKNVIIIGAGASGLAAARQLQNFGTQVKILHSVARLPWPHISPPLSVRRHVPLHSSFPSIYRCWCLRQGRELEVESGMILLWASRWVEVLKLSMAV